MKTLLAASLLVLVGCNIDDGRPSREEILQLRSAPSPKPQAEEPQGPKQPTVIDVQSELKKAEDEGRQRDAETIKKIQELMQRMDEKELQLQQQKPPRDDEAHDKIDKLQKELDDKNTQLEIQKRYIDSNAQLMEGARSRLDKLEKDRESSDFVKAFGAQLEAAVENVAAQQVTAYFFTKEHCDHCAPAWDAYKPVFKQRNIEPIVVHLEDDETVFDKYKVNATPTVVLVSPKFGEIGRVVGNDKNSLLKVLDQNRNLQQALPIGSFKINDYYKDLAGKTFTFGSLVVKIPQDTRWKTTYTNGVRDITLVTPVEIELHKYGTWKTTFNGTAFTTDSAVVRLGGLLVPDIKAGADWSSP